MKIAMIVINDAINDVRVMKEARTLCEAGHEIYIFGYGNENQEFNIDNIKIINTKISYVDKFILSLKKGKNNGFQSTSQDLVEGNIKRKPSLKHKLKELVKGKIIIASIEVNQNSIYKTIKKSPVKFHCIHCHDLNTLRIGVQYKKENNCKLVYDSHELWTEMSGINKYVKRKYSKAEAKLIKYADTIITVSPSICKELQKRYGIDKEAVLLRNIPSYDHIGKTTCPNVQEIKMIYVGYFIPGRGVETIISNFHKFPNNVTLCLRVQKDEKVIAQLNKNIKELNLSHRIFVLEFLPQNEVIGEISKYDIGVLPYLPVSLNNLYCLPNKIFQYLAGGVGILANNLPDVKEVLEKYNCGVTYDSEDETSLVEAVKALCHNVENLDKLKKNSLKAIEENLNWDKEKMKLIHVYKE